MKKLLNKISVGLMAVLGFFGFVGTKMASAAVDPDLQNALASTTGFASDNKSQILTYIVGIIIVVFVITIAKKAILWGFSKLAGVFGRGGRRRR